MKNLFIISEEEKNRILNLHENATKNLYLLEQVISDYDSKYDYKREGDKFFFKLKTSDNWREAGGTSLEAIKRKVYKISDGQESNTITTSPNKSPFKTKEEGDAFRKWVNKTLPSLARKLDLDPSGSHTNSYIINAWNHKFKLINGETTTLGDYYKQNSSTLTPSKPSSGNSISSNISPDFKNKFDLNALSTTDSTFVCKAGQEECGQFVNDFTTKLGYVGNAWLAHDVDRVGKRVMSSYTSLSEDQIEEIFNIFKAIESQGGPQERKSGGQVTNIKRLQNELIKDVPATDLKIDDVVGIYYPPSSHHEEAFYEAGKPYFISDEKGGWNKGRTISKGQGFGMNTHVGIVGAIKDGVPLIFHNISGNVYSDPYNKIRGGGKIVWIKRGGK